MAQADFTYPPADAAVGTALGASIFADRPQLRGEMRDDATGAGLAVRECGPLAALADDASPDVAAGGPGDVVLVDCPVADATALSALARLDLRAARSGAQVVISTSMAALDDIFACCDQSAPQILVDPGRGERVMALGRALALVPDRRLRELAGEDRLLLLRLMEQLGRMAERMERWDGGGAIRGDAAFRVESPAPGFHGADGSGDGGGHGDGGRLMRPARPPLPEPRLVRRIIRQRQLRARFLDGDLFADPAWDMLLDLTAARAEHERVSVTSLCIASGVPPTTALRWIGQMTEAGLFQRVEDETDRRRAFIALTDRAADAMARYFAELGRMAAHMV